MHRPLIAAVTALLLAGAAGCSSTDAEQETGSGSAAGSDSGSSSSTVARGGSESGGSPSAGGVGTPRESDGSRGSGGAPFPPAGVLLGADSLPTPAADHCRTQNLTAVARSTGRGLATLVITNEGTGSCTVRGFPSLLFKTEIGPTELPVDWAGSATEAAKFTLSPGESASAALSFTSLDECEPVTGLDLVPPGESRALTPAFTTTNGKKAPVRICDTGVRVQAFSPMR
ncbi:DUF4232 domain-containing protein [Streptomyces adustus]|uniref:DUF4232 domain-containing protein n=1 Tax=Streptomyces adustus TaxID=1609272 RepID=A0A5N8VBR9_9ACTN|nr:DUF4232 domain-containing protein [Streptomyces adustus]MPY31484.1 DUF4232 domain-containing protein [Streptomyces adustus]